MIRDDIDDCHAGVSLSTFAAFLGHADIVKFLWHKGYRDSFTLMGAVCAGNLDLVKFLVDNGADWDAHVSAGSLTN